jgi:MATE family multidrug resistance protein
MDVASPFPQSSPMSQTQALSKSQALHLQPVEVTHAAVVRLALPMTLAHLSTPLLGFVDAAVIGRLGQAHLLGAIAAAAVVFDFIFWGFGFLRMGTASLTAQSTGRGDVMENRAVLLRALIIAVALGLVMIGLQAPIAWIGFGLLQASEPVTEAARSYYDVRIWSAPFALANYALLGAFIGRGKTGIALGLQVVVNLSNMIFNIAFVYGLSMGVRGSALGTLCAETLGAIAGLLVLTQIDRSWFSVETVVLRNRARVIQMVSINGDLVIRTAALLFSYAFFTSQGARHGDVLLAANAVLMNLYLIGAYFLDGFATAAQQLCGQAFGAGDGMRFRRAVRLTAIWSLGFSAALSVAAFLSAPAFIAFVSTNEAVRQAAWSYIPYAALACFLGAPAFEFDGVFIGAAWTRDMRNLMLAALAFYLAAFWALGGLGNAGLWLSFMLFLTARGAGQFWRYRYLVKAAFPASKSQIPAPAVSNQA